jgi:hypothetical protein
VQHVPRRGSLAELFQPSVEGIGFNGGAGNRYRVAFTCSSELKAWLLGQAVSKLARHVEEGDECLSLFRFSLRLNVS